MSLLSLLIYLQLCMLTEHRERRGYCCKVCLLSLVHFHHLCLSGPLFSFCTESPSLYQHRPCEHILSRGTSETRSMRDKVIDNIRSTQSCYLDPFIHPSTHPYILTYTHDHRRLSSRRKLNDIGQSNIWNHDNQPGRRKFELNSLTVRIHQ